MAVVTLIPEALRGNFTSGPLTIPANTPRGVKLKMTSPTFPTDASLVFDLMVSRSPDGIQPFVSWFGSNGFGGGLGTPGKFGVPLDGLYVITASFDGVACVARVDITVNIPFVWGLTAELI